MMPYRYGNSRDIWDPECHLPPGRDDIPAITSANHELYRCYRLDKLEEFFVQELQE